MPIRITGMNSGLDTEAIITELVKAEQKKVETTKKEKTTFEWKQEAWKELNSKIYKLFHSTLDNMRFSGDWSKKVTDISNSSVASIVTADTAMNVSQELKVNKLATAGYVTGGKVTFKDGDGNPTDSIAGNDTKLSELGFTDDDGTGTIEVNGKTFTVTKDTTIRQFTQNLLDAGVEASYDWANGRLHIAAKNNGESVSLSGADDSGKTALGILGLTKEAGAQIKEGSSAEIELNGVIYKSNNNTFTVNGLTITAKEVSTSPVTLTTRRDTDGVYNTVKNFIKEYDALINEMDKLYNAESSKGYEPLTDEEKDSMSESEIEKWEDKIKSAVLRRDSTLNTIASSMKEIMLQGVTVNGKKMYLSNFGINTLGYYDSEENERNAYHINGDEDFLSVLTESNQLKAMVEQDPDTVIEFFSQLSMNLYKKLESLSSSIDGVRSYGKFYDDKIMEEEYKNYESKIAKQEQALADKEDKWYQKFTAMETALAKLQSNQNALASLLGG